jgi:hypothetical protein
VIVATGGACLAEGLFSVVGNRATNSCEIVTSNPAVYGDIRFVDCPCKSKADTRLARSTIGACPRENPKDDPSAE